jgi:hypothetical protein
MYTQECPTKVWWYVLTGVVRVALWAPSHSLPTDYVFVLSRKELRLLLEQAFALWELLT